MPTRVLGALKPEVVWSIFENISRIPRPSGKEEQIREWIRKWAKGNSINVKEDETGNLLLTKGAKTGCEQYPALILQAHIDMVYQKLIEVDIDFEKDPLEIEIHGERVRARGTTLGADNGTGMAYGLAVLITESISHGPPEVLLTVSEEAGFTGAFGVKPGFFK